MKVSFDFDSVLSREKVQKYATSLIEKGVDVWVCTSRTSPENSSKGWNDDLFLVTDNLGIKRENIIFTNMEDKSEHLNGKGFICHLDDMMSEIVNINEDSDLKGVLVLRNSNWKQITNNLLKK
jgi:hypothetical protein